MQPKNILVRLPNWLGVVVMATALLQQLALQHPQATIDVICKKQLGYLKEHLPINGHVFLFDKAECKGMRGAYRFATKNIVNRYDAYFCLPVSASSLAMSLGIKATAKIGFKHGLSGLVYTVAVKKPTAVHRVKEYLSLLNANADAKPVLVPPTPTDTAPYGVVNINSEASSRRLPVHKAVSIINQLQKQNSIPLKLIGSDAEKNFVTAVYDQLAQKQFVENLAGKTSLPTLIRLLAQARFVLSTDSGPAHVANALHTKVVVLFGAGNEFNTAPYDKSFVRTLRLGKLNCEPCTKNKCPLYDEPKCLTMLDETAIAQAVLQIQST